MTIPELPDANKYDIGVIGEGYVEGVGMILKGGYRPTAAVRDGIARVYADKEESVRAKLVSGLSGNKEPWRDPTGPDHRRSANGAHDLLQLGKLAALHAQFREDPPRQVAPPDVTPPVQDQTPSGIVGQSHTTPGMPTRRQD